jgi:hypothetical protein
MIEAVAVAVAVAVVIIGSVVIFKNSFYMNSGDEKSLRICPLDNIYIRNGCPRFEIPFIRREWKVIATGMRVMSFENVSTKTKDEFTLNYSSLNIIYAINGKDNSAIFRLVRQFGLNYEELFSKLIIENFRLIIAKSNLEEITDEKQYEISNELHSLLSDKHAIDMHKVQFLVSDKE